MLPILNTPTYEVKLPISNKTIKYRPYLVKEEKILLMALESGDQGQVMQAMNDIIEACTFNAIKANELPIAETELLFLKLRSKSVGEIAKIGLKCNSCQHDNTVNVNLDEFTLPEFQAKSNKIVFDGTKVGVIMKIPSSGDLLKYIDQNSSDVANTYNVIIGCIESIFDETYVFDAAIQPREDLDRFIDSLNKKQFEQIKEFISSIPKLSKNIEYTCQKCNAKNEILLEGIQSFFI